MPLTIYRSSAGSGKTFTLVKEYLKLVLKKPSDYKNILAITFTNKATDEMKKRVLEELTQIAEGKSTDMEHLIREELIEEGAFVTDMQDSAKKTLNNILHNYSRFEVSTIDSFFTRIIQAFSKEFQLPMNYAIDLENNKALQEAQDKMYAEMHSMPQTAKWLKNYAQQLIQSENKWKTSKGITDLSGAIFEEIFYEISRKTDISIDALEKRVNEFWKEKRTFENTVKKNAKAIFKFLDDFNIKTTDFKRGTITAFTNYLKDKKIEFGATILKILDGEATWYAQKSPKKEAIQNALDSGLQALVEESFKYINNNLALYNANKAALKNIFAFGVLKVLQEKLRDYREENNLLLLADVIPILRDTIGKNDAPFILEKVGSTYKHILIDEFQDTSNHQWANLLPLLENILADDNQVLIVGDVKQSIYRWRGGNMKLLLEQVENDLLAFAENTFNKNLSNNYRTLENIVLFNNAFFKSAIYWITNNVLPSRNKLQYIIAKSYQSITQTPKKGKNGYVEIKFLPEDKSGRTVIKSWKEYAQEYVIEVIQELKGDGFNLKDILILVRTNKEASEISEFLTKNRVKIVTQSSMLLKKSKEVSFLIAMLRFFSQKHDPIIKRNALYQFYTFLSPDKTKHLHQILSATETTIDSLIQEILPELFTKNLDHLQRKPVFELLSELMIAFEINQETNSYTQRLLDLALEQSTKGANDVHSFLEWWDDKDNLTILNPETNEAITVMTVHKAKGLEEKVVILPFSGFSFTPNANTIIWSRDLGKENERYNYLPINFSKDLQGTVFNDVWEQEIIENYLDMLNTAYVGFTRPVERLYIMSKDVSKDKSKNELQTLSNLLYNVIESEDFEFKKNWDAAEKLFFLGEKFPKISKNDKKTTSNQSISIDLGLKPFEDKVKIKSEEERYFMVLDPEKASKVDEGIKIHNILERLRKKEDLGRVIDYLIMQGELNEKDKEVLPPKINELFELPQMQDWFDVNKWKVLTERDLYSQGELYKPDRVIKSLDDSETVIIDYKREVKTTKHIAQLREYGSILEKMGGQNSIKMYLLYVENNEVVEVLF